MRRAEADRLLTALLAAFPFPAVPQATIELYRTKLLDLSDVESARNATDELIESELRFPSLAAITGAYRRAVAKVREENERAKRALPEPELVPGREFAHAVVREFRSFETAPEGELGSISSEIRSFFERIAADDEETADPDESGTSHDHEGGER